MPKIRLLQLLILKNSKYSNCLLILIFFLGIFQCGIADTKRANCNAKVQSNHTENSYLKGSCMGIMIFQGTYYEPLIDVTILGCLIQEERIRQCNKIPLYEWEADKDTD